MDLFLEILFKTFKKIKFNFDSWHNFLTFHIQFYENQIFFWIQKNFHLNWLFYIDADLNNVSTKIN